MSSSDFEVKDPLQAYIDRPTNQDASTLIKDSTAACNSTALLWRQNKEDSFSDWTIVLIADDPAQCDDENQEDSPERCTKRLKSDYQSSTFHVHRGTLATLSRYFKTQFSTQVDTLERKTSTSIIRLHPHAIDAFPVFLDYIYRPEQGMTGFTRENAVALRHLALYFGVDVLFEEITNIILADMKNKKSREKYQSNSSALFDLKLLEAIKVMDLQQESLKAVVPALFQTLIGNPAKYLQNDNELVLAWKHVMSLVDSHQNKFYVEKNKKRFPDLSVANAGLRHVNGEYKLAGCWNNAGYYTNGVCLLSRLKNGAWSLTICYHYYGADQEIGRKSQTLYSSSSTSDRPPSRGWRPKYTEKKSEISKDPGPAITVLL